MRTGAIKSYLRPSIEDVTIGLEDTLLIQIGQDYGKPPKVNSDDRPSLASLPAACLATIISTSLKPSSPFTQPLSLRTRPSKAPVLASAVETSSLDSLFQPKTEACVSSVFAALFRSTKIQLLNLGSAPEQELVAADVVMEWDLVKRLLGLLREEAMIVKPLGRLYLVLCPTWKTSISKDRGKFVRVGSYGQNGGQRNYSREGPPTSKRRLVLLKLPTLQPRSQDAPTMLHPETQELRAAPLKSDTDDNLSASKQPVYVEHSKWWSDVRHPERMRSLPIVPFLVT